MNGLDPNYDDEDRRHLDDMNEALVDAQAIVTRMKKMEESLQENSSIARREDTISLGGAGNGLTNIPSTTSSASTSNNLKPRSEIARLENIISAHSSPRPSPALGDDAEEKASSTRLPKRSSARPPPSPERPCTPLKPYPRRQSAGHPYMHESIAGKAIASPNVPILAPSGAYATFR